jgi:hypothetical protein
VEHRQSKSSAVHGARGRLASYLGSGAVLSVAMLWSGTALAEFHFSPYAGVTEEYNSNIFYLPPDSPPMVGSNGPSYSDEVLTTRVGADLTYNWSQQKFHFTAEGSRLDYNHFSDQTHDESRLDGGLDWKLTDLWDGTLDYQRLRHAVPYYLLTAGSSVLELETDNIASAGVNLNITSVWRIETLGTATDDDSPREGLPNLSTRERYGQVSLRYLGVGNLSAGVQYGYLSGSFNGEPPGISPDYRQSTEQAVADYKVSGLTTLNAAAGYAKRIQGGADIGGFTGLVGYTRQLTGKTSMNLQLSRVVQTYVTTLGSEVDSNATLGFAWQATSKISVAPGYTWTSSSFPGQVDLIGNERLDHSQNLNLDVTWQALRWLSVRPYARYQTRNSNLLDYRYNVDIFGMDVQARLP